MIDVDHLREYNNRFGHLKASAVLAKVGNVLGRSLGNVGWIAKYGGDEFLVVLPRTRREDAIRAAHNLRLAIEGADTGNAAFGTMTCSFGVATAPEDGNTFVDLLDAADRALFQAKAQGRNTVVAATHKRSRRSTRRRRAA
jgi:diguanylate cyclase (GGDEF)-like protein